MGSSIALVAFSGLVSFIFCETKAKALSHSLVKKKIIVQLICEKMGENRHNDAQKHDPIHM